MGQITDTRQSFLRSIAKDPTANTIAIAAASLIPLLAMVGGGVDASRYYMTETRLQAACDAGALAARRAMDDSTFESEHRQIGENFFDQNFEDGLFGLEGLKRDYTATNDGTVSGSAEGTLPTSIMGAFGYTEFDLEVDCSAEINISNTDVMFVLDVTGSMNCSADGSNCSSSNTNSRISNLRSSVLTFYDTVDSATSASAQIRYGIVPYAAQVNVGDSLDTSWMATSHTYQSREADWIITTTYEPESYTYVRTGDATNFDFQGRTEENDYNVTTFDDCVALINTRQDIFVRSSEPTWTQVSQSGSNPRTTVYNGVVTYESFQFNGGFYYGSSDRCQLFYNHNEYDAVSTITVIEGATEEREFQWAYRPVNYDLTSLYSTGSLVTPTGRDEANETHTWNGCIEEADTVQASVLDPLPTGAYDLNIDLVPGTPAERWKPMMPDITYLRYNDGANWWDTTNWERGDVFSTEDKVNGFSPCPKAARKLAPFDSRADLESWVSASNGFTAAGNTYHDFGMIWGGRFITPDGIFASENATAPNGDAISRHIVFMTDGNLVTRQYRYGLYGMEWWERRTTTDGTDAQQRANHAERFQAACRAARNKNISVWVVAFGTSLSQNLIDCATPGRAYHADDAAELDTAFREIAELIAALRLTA